ncbi:putative peptidoglycan peptidase [Escherichia coli]|nr:putative peptidoglycan peptidase [Escherichia coli]
MKNRLLILSLLVSVPAFAWQPQTGDIIFQISRSSQSKAIQLATHSDYSHTGMLVIRNKKPYVFEAVGPVKYTPLKGRCEQVPDMRSCLSSGAMEQGSS